MYYACLRGTRLLPLGPGETRAEKYCPHCKARRCCFDNLAPADHIIAIKHGRYSVLAFSHRSRMVTRVDRLDAKERDQRVEKTHRVLLQMGGWVRGRDVAEAMGLGDRSRTVSDYLRRLRDQGRAEMRGRGRNVQYRGLPIKEGNEAPS